MDSKTIFTKTAKGLGEVSGKTKALSRDLRNILKEIDGKSPFAELLDKVGTTEPKLREALNKLMADNYIREFVQQTLGENTRALDFSTIAPPGATPAPPRKADPPLRRAADMAPPLTQSAPAISPNTELQFAEFRRLQMEEQARAEEKNRAKKEAEAKRRREQEDRVQRELEEWANKDLLPNLPVGAAAAAPAVDTAAAEAAEAKRRADEEAKRQADEIARIHAQAQEQARREAEVKAQQAAEAQARAAAEQARKAAEEKARQEAEQKARQEAEQKARAEAEEQARKAAAEKARVEAEAKARQEAEAKARREAEEQARKAAEEQARKAAAEKARVEAEAKARWEAEQARKAAEEKAQQEAEQKARIEAEQKARQAAELKARQEAEERARKAAAAQAQLDAEKELEEMARLQAEEQDRRDAEERARKQAEREAQERARKEAVDQARKEAQRVRQEADEKIKREAAEQEKREAEDWVRQEMEERERRAAEARGAEALEQDSEIDPETRYEPAQEYEPEPFQDDPHEERRDTYAEPEPLVAAAAPAPITDRRYQKRRSLLKPVLLIIIAAIAGTLGLMHVVSYDSRIPAFEKAASAQFGQPVKIKALYIALFPQPHWTLEKVTVGEGGQISAPKVKAATGLGALYGGDTAFKSIEMESPVLTETGLDWLLFGKGAGSAVKFDRLAMRKATLDSQALNLGSFDAVASMADGAWKDIVVDAPETRLHLRLQPKGDSLQMDMTADSFKLPFGAGLTLENVSADGLIGRNEINLAQFKSSLRGGSLVGNARLRREGGWKLAGQLTASGLDAVSFAPSALLAGRGSGDGVFVGEGSELSKLLSKPRIEGNFTIKDGVLLGADLAGLLKSGNVNGKTTFAELSGGYLYEADKLQLRQVGLNAGLLSAKGAVEVEPDQSVKGRFHVEIKSASIQSRANLNVAGTVKEPRYSP